MTRFIEIITNKLILQKQLLELKLEEKINSKENKVEKRTDEAIELLSEISKISNAQNILNSYINTNNTK